MSRRVRVAAVVAAAVIVALVGGFYAWTRVARYAAFPEAVAVAESAERVRGWTVFAPEGAPAGEPSGEAAVGFVFYPGGLVDPLAYAPLLQRLADGGALAVLVPMPLDLAVFGIGRAADVIAAFPEVGTWAIGGHSLGGAMAAEFVKGGATGVDGIVFLASYPAASTDLSALPIQALSTYGSENGQTPPEGFADAMVRLPPGSELVEIEGGNHAGFGHYGPQAGDGVATIEREEQQRQAAETVLGFLRDLR
ncbi:MAG: alpha/beta hydrolase [Trueperaceae bacterium]